MNPTDAAINSFLLNALKCIVPALVILAVYATVIWREERIYFGKGKS